MLHILHMKEPARVIDIHHHVDGTSHDANNDNKVVTTTTIRPGEGARVTFEFTRRPAYVHEGMRIIMRDGHVRGIGRVVSVFER